MVVLSIIATLVAITSLFIAFKALKKFRGATVELARQSTQVQLLADSIKGLKEGKEDEVSLPEALSYNARKKTLTIKCNLAVTGNIASGSTEEEEL